MKEKYETREALDEFMKNKVYGPGGTMDKTLKLRGNPKVYFDITAGGEAIGRVVMQLRQDVVPKTAENFRQLCLKPEGEGYKKCSFHRERPRKPRQRAASSRGKTASRSCHGESQWGLHVASAVAGRRKRFCASSFYDSFPACDPTRAQV